MDRFLVNDIYSPLSRESVFECSAEGIVVVDDSGAIVKVNNSANGMFSYDSGELLGKKIEDLIPTRFLSNHRSLREEYKNSFHPRTIGVGKDLFAKRKDGSEFPVEISLSPIQNSSGFQFVMAYIIDTSLRKRKDEELVKAHNDLLNYSEALKKSNAELENFANIASHDLQEPLRKIISFGERLQISEMQNLSEGGKNYLIRMQSAAARMQELIGSLLHFSRLSSENEKFQPVNLTNTLFQVLDDLEVAIENSKAQFEIDELPVIDGSSYQIAQLFQNLIGNAIKFRKKDVSPLIKISCQKKMGLTVFEEMIEIQIEDNGIGFNEKHSAKIFDLFQQIEGKKYGGSGIGLATCKKITLKHGGDIVVKSEEGKGSSFFITLKTKHH